MKTMSSRKHVLAVGMIVALAVSSWGKEAQTNATLSLAIDLVDGSRLIGTPGIATVPVQTSYAKMDVPLTQIQALKIGDDHETVTLNLRNGDTLTGVISLKPIEMKTVFGTVAVGIEHIQRLQVMSDYYVDASRPSDAGDGLSWATAKRTIQAAVDVARDGDTVLVTNGVYNSGVRVTPGHTLNNRVLVSRAVTVRSVNGPEVTIIEGSGASAYNTADAVRCALLLDGKLEGFTLRGGATYAHSDTHPNGYDKGGGGVNLQGCTPGTAVVNCIIRDCRAYDGGGAIEGPYESVGSFINCLIYGNHAAYGGGAYRANLINCTVVHNSASADCGGAYHCVAVNCVIYGNGKNYHAGSLTHCCTTPLTASGAGNLAAEPLFVNAGAGDYRLRAESPCVDTGNSAAVAGALDLAGRARIHGKAVDMGAYECDTTLYTAAGDDIVPKESPLRLELDLVDGSRLIGTPGIATVPVQTAYAKMDVPLTQIQALKIGDDHETVTLNLRNGDTLTGVISLKPIKLETVFGTIAIGIEHIQQLDIVLSGGTNQKGLVLWNRLGSESEVKNSRVGLGGKRDAGRFVEGRFGQGIELNMQEPFGVTFPAEIVPASAGCIEFWAKLVGFPDNITQGYHPSLIRSDTPEGSGFHVFFAPNNGAAGGGLCINSRLGWVGTGPFGSWSYATALKSAKPGDWHHYAVVWNGVGNIPNVADTTRKISVFVDGQLNTTTSNKSPEEQLFAPGNAPRFGFIGFPTDAIPGASIVFDNLKIWNYAKTDFNDRDNE
jgi:hypothetical protein